MEEKASILIVDDDESICGTLTLIFGKKGYKTEMAGSGREAIDKALERFFNLILMDIKLPDTEGTELVAPLKEIHPDMMVIMVTAYASLETAVRALNAGASAYIIKPLDMDEVLATVGNALEKQRLIMENRKLLKVAERELDERKRAEEKIRSLAKFPSEDPNPVLRVTKGGILLYANKASLPLLNVWSCQIGQLLPEYWRKFIWDIFSSSLTKNIEVECEDRIFSLTLAPIVDADYVNLYGLDITERKRAEEERKQSSEKLQRALEETVNALALAAEMRDPHTAGHQRRVTQLACAIAKEMGLPEEQIYGIRMAGMIHDIGKIHIPAETFSKPSRLTETEFAMIKNHPQVGYAILKEIKFPWPVAQIVLQHHERMNGSGYPQGLKGEDILLEARILGVADVVEATSSHRLYRPDLGIDKALEEISQKRGILYDPKVVDACLRLFKVTKKAKKDYLPFWGE